MSCASCGRENRAGARFCAGCGASLAPRCPACGVEARPDARFCDACGAALAPAPAPAEASVARKVVTIVFADLIGSTALQEKLDPESVSRVMEAYHAAVRVPVEAHGGTVVQLLGDGVMCAFGVPRVAEDDALRAVRAAVAVQQAFRAFVAEHPELAGKVGLRVAVNTGEVVVSDDYAAGIGDPLNVAARLQQEARDGDVLIGESTQRHVREKVTLAQVGSFALKGRAEPVAAYRVVSLERPPGAAAVPFVGREEELRRLQAVYDAAVSTPAARLAVLLGSPGLGKSRLVAELAQRLEGRVELLAARCESARGATFAPLAAALRAHLGERGEPGAQVEALLPADEPDRARIVAGVAALLAGEPASPQETFFVVRRFLAALAKARPVLLLIDDLHWAEPLLLDLVEHLVQWGSGVRLLVLAAARPELRALRSSLATPGPLASDVVTLAGLDAVAATQLAARVIGAEAFPAAIAGRVLAASEGNPLFLAELVRMLVDDGVLRRQGEAWVAADAIADFAMPPSIQALLAARIERLAPEERTVLERAAVVGRHFSRSALAALLPRELSDLDARLEALRRSELIEPDTGWLLGEPALRFHHALIRDAAYRRVLKNTRAELHARIAGWMEERAGAAVEHDETIGWHFEQAHQNLRELGPLDERGRAFGARAARYLGAAGQRALARDDLPLAAGLLGRALERLEPESAARTELLLDRCEALLATGEVGAATPAVAELERLAAGSERLHAWHTCFAGQLAALTDPEALRATAEAAAAAAQTLAAAGDGVGEAKAHSVQAGALARLGAIGACEAALDRALAAARRAGDRRRSNAVLGGAPLAALFGPSPVTRASGRCLDVVRVLRITQGAPAVEAVALRCQAVLEALRGRLDAARRMISASRRLVEELGITQQLLESDVFAGQIEWLAGDAVAAERWLRDAYTGMRQRGLRIDAARAAAQLGRVLLAEGRAREAESLSHESESLAGDDLQAAIAWRGVRAEALAQRGEHTAASELARSAVEIASATDALLHHADARRALAAVLAAAGRAAEAAQEEARAVELWEAKGATLLAERARGGAQRVAPAATTALRPVPAPQRRVRENAATAAGARILAAAKRRDLEAIGALIADDFELLHHPTGGTVDRDAGLARWRLLLQAEGLVISNEPIATLGESLALSRDLTSFERLAQDELVFGASRSSYLNLGEVNERGQLVRMEVFAEDRLAEAVARLYAWHAELAPDAERSRAAAVARAVALMLGPFDARAIGAILAPGAEYRDLRTLGSPGFHGADAIAGWLATLSESALDVVVRLEEVLATSASVALARWLNTGREPVGGGAFERRMLTLFEFDAGGRISRWEQFDPERVAEALARFDELAGAQPAPLLGRVRPNAATAQAARMDAAVGARDLDAIAVELAELVEVVEHPLGAVFDASGMLAAWRELLRAEAPVMRSEPLATLGDSLALCRSSMSFAALAPRLENVLGSFGAVEREVLVLFEMGPRGLQRRTELFAPDHLGDAVARLYERHAELLPEGPERTRAKTTARAVAAWLERESRADRFDGHVAPSLRLTDHRRAGFGSVHGADAFLQGHRALFELARDVSLVVEGVLGLAPDAFLLRTKTSGIDRRSGGEFERPLLLLGSFGADGLIARVEWFDPERPDDALARFDALTAEPPGRRVQQNAATENARRLDAAIAARDADAFGELVADPTSTTHHPTGVEYGRDNVLRGLQRWIDVPAARYRHDPLATLGGSLALCRTSASASRVPIDDLDLGPVERENVALIETDVHGRRRRAEVFAVERLDDAVARLYERHAELLPEGPERHRAEGIAQTLAAFARGDPERLADRVAPDCTYVDHRPLGFPALRGAEQVRLWIRSIDEVADDAVFRMEDVLGNRANVLLDRGLNTGSERGGGGAFERRFLALRVFDADGRVARWEQFDLAQLDEALARFDATAVEPPAARFENAVTRTEELFSRLWHAGDWEAWAALTPPDFRSIDRRPLMHLEVDGETMLRGVRPFFEMGAERTSQLLATRGERLALFRMRLRASDTTGGVSEVEFLQVIEVDERGQRRAAVAFGSDDLDAAHAELDARYGAGEGAAHAALLSNLQEFRRALAGSDRGALARLLPDDFQATSHRRFANGGAALSRDEYVASLGLNDVLGVQADLHLHHLRVSAAALIGEATWHGTREGGEFAVSVVFVATHDGERLRSWELFDPEQTDAALARYAEFSSARAASRFENAATRLSDRIHAAWAARDWKAFAANYPPGFQIIDRQQRVQLDSGRDGWLASYHRIFEMPSSQLAQRIVATRGERLGFAAVRWEGRDDVVGTSELDWLIVIEVDERGSGVTQVVLDGDALDAAYAELDARYTAGEGAGDVAWRDVVAWTTAFNSRDFEGLARRLSPDFALHDHRALGWGTVDGARWVELLRSLTELAPDSRYRLHHFVSGARGCLTVGTVLGTRDGGAFEMTRISVVELDATGRRRRMDQYDDVTQLDAARARFAELSARAGPPRFANRAFRALERLGLAWRARNWEAVVATYARGFVLEDRRALVGLPVAGEDFLANVRFMYAIPSSRFEFELLATRGERLVLCRTRFTGEADGGGAFEWPMLTVVEVDDRGCLTWHVVFDRDAVDAAFAELDARYTSGEGADDAAWRDLVAWMEAFERRDFEALARRLSPDFALHDHRALGWGTVDAARYVDLLRSITELAPDARYRLDHYVRGGRGTLTVGSVLGTRDGGAFEMTRISVVELDAAGRRRRTDQYDDDAQLDAALARFTELRAPAVAGPLANAATRAMEQVVRHWDARDWESLVAMYPPGFELDDRRPLVGLPVSGDDFLANLRLLFALRSSRFHFEPLATRGERLVLARSRFRGEAGAGGAIDVPMLSLVEVAGDGRYARVVAFDPAALDAAFAELDTRYFAGEAAAHPRLAATMQGFLAAFASRDWDALGALFAADVEVRDQRRLGFEPLAGRRAYVDSLRALVELAPDVALRIDHARLAGRGALWVASWIGTREGGPFETPWVIVSEHDAAGVVQRFDQYDVDRLDAALARFAELRADPLAIPPNAATRLSERLHATFAEHDAATFEALIAPTFWMDDRRRGVRLGGDRAALLASAAAIRSANWRPLRTVLATAGDRLALERKVWRSPTGDAEVETLDVFEVDAEGRLLASVVFDPEDRRAASLELFERWARSKGGGRLLEEALEARRAIFDHDLARLRELLPARYEFHDHRRTGPGLIEGAEGYLAWLASLFERSADAIIEPLYFIADEPHGSLRVGHTFGTLVDGGAFENVFVMLIRTRGVETLGAELFELEDLERARARFEELRPDPLRIPRNAARRAGERVGESRARGDWPALRALVAPDFRFEDRRKHALVSGGVELYVRNLEIVHAYPDLKVTFRPLATAGERVSLTQLSYTGDPTGSAFEGDFLLLIEVDAEERVVASLHFDVDDRAAAFEELQRRFVAGEAGGSAEQAAIAEIPAAFNRRDWRRLAACFTDDARSEEHRTLGLGDLSIEDWIESLRSLAELAPDVNIELLRILAWDGRGRVSLMRQHGTREGGPFENVFVALTATRGGRVSRLERFDVADAERAVARFAELPSPDTES